MDYKACEILNKNFRLDDRYNIFLVTNEDIQVTDGPGKGYIYAAMFFYDEVDKEIKKLVTIIREKSEAIKLDTPELDISMLVLELSRRVKAVIGDDSLDALIKEVLGETETAKSIGLTPEDAELKKLYAVKDGVLSESMGILLDTVIRNRDTICKDCGGELSFDTEKKVFKCKNCGHTLKQDDGHKKVELSKNYVRTLTVRQKKLLAPAIKMVGFLNQIRLDDFEIRDAEEEERYIISFSPSAMSAPFAVQEEAIKRKLKDMMAKGLATETPKTATKPEKAENN